MARPVRLLLCRQLGADIDGAWWPHTASVAAELPELIGVLHAPLGEIVDGAIAPFGKELLTGERRSFVATTELGTVAAGALCCIHSFAPVRLNSSRTNSSRVIRGSTSVSC